MIWRQPEPDVEPLVISIPMSDATKRICDRAISAAIENWNEFLSPSHLLIGIVSAEPNSASDLLREMGIEAADILAGIKCRQGPFKVSNVFLTTPYTDQILQSALHSAAIKGRKDVEPIDLLFAIVGERESAASELLSRLSNTLKERAATDVLFQGRSTTPTTRPA